MKLPVEYLALFEPPPGQVAIIRDEQPGMVGKIIVPENVRARQRSAAATVWAVGAAVPFKCGDRVLVQAGITRRVDFETESGRGQHTLFIARSHEIVGWIDAVTATESPAAVQGSVPIPGEILALRDEPQTEGTPKAGQ